MSKNTLKKEIHKEIKNINTLIDMRIIKGLSYKDLSRRHKFLISQLNSLALKQTMKVRVPIKTQSNGPIGGFIEILGRYASTFIF
ncbi:MAG: hypothetical protein AAB637_01310 [Patescibacteria group bacterium]